MLGTSPDSIDLAEDRERFNALCTSLGIAQPPGGTATTTEQAQAIAAELGFPVLVRPSYVLGGRAMQIVYDDDSLDAAMAELAAEGTLGREGGLSAERPGARRPLPRGRGRGRRRRHPRRHRRVGHRRRDGAHRGGRRALGRLRVRDPAADADRRRWSRASRRTPRALADALDVRGLLNVQYAVKDDEVFVIEANPRASRTVPFVSKATGVPLAKVASRVMVGATLAELRAEGPAAPARRGRARRGEGGGAAVQPLPRRRHRARSRDALHRRGDGHRPLVRPRVRQEPDRGREPHPARGHGVPLARRPRQARGAGRGARASPSSASRSWRPPAPPPRSRPTGSRSRRWSASSPRATARRRRADLVGQGRPGREHPAGPGAPGRRRPHPPDRHRPRDPVRHHRGRRARRRRPASPSGSRPRPRSARCRSTTATASSGWGCSGRPRRLARVAHAAGADPHGRRARSGTATRSRGSATRRASARSRRSRCSPEPWPGKPPPRLHMTASGMVNAVGLQGPGVERVARARPPRAARDRRARDRVGVGSHRRRLRTRDGDARRRATSSRSRST